MFDIHIIIILSNGGQKDSSPNFYISPVWGTTNGTFKSTVLSIVRRKIVFKSMLKAIQLGLICQNGSKKWKH